MHIGFITFGACALHINYLFNLISGIDNLHAIHLTHLAVDFGSISRIWYLGFGFYLTDLAYRLREMGDH